MGASAAELATRAAGGLDTWIEALNRPGDAAAIHAAVEPLAVVERFGFGPQRGQCVEHLRGADAIAAWAALTNPVCRFARDGDARIEADGVTATVRYAITADDFRGGGVWRFRLGRRGRLAWLRHEPDDLLPQWRGPVELWDRIVAEPGPATDHDHSH